MSKALPPLLDVHDLVVRHRTAHGALDAVRSVSLRLAAGQTTALIGESGCGKTSLGKTLVGLNRAAAGEIRFDGVDLAPLSRRGWQPHRRAIQMVFQDPLSALDPQQRARQAVALPLRLHGWRDAHKRGARISELMSQVGLDEALLDRYPHQLSGGQRQRLNIARALAPEPRLIVCDEPVSALDVSLQAQIMALLKQLQRQLGLTLLFISHDLAVVEAMADRIAVMYLGRIVEVLPKASLWSARHPYTRLLLRSIPRHTPGVQRPADDDSDATGLAADPPDPFAPPSGCAFHPRCPRAQAVCREQVPSAMVQTVDTVSPEADAASHAASHVVSCFFPIMPAPSGQTIPGAMHHACQ